MTADFVVPIQSQSTFSSHIGLFKDSTNGLNHAASAERWPHPHPEVLHYWWLSHDDVVSISRVARWWLHYTTRPHPAHRYSHVTRQLTLIQLTRTGPAGIPPSSITVVGTPPAGQRFPRMAQEFFRRPHPRTLEPQFRLGCTTSSPGCTHPLSCHRRFTNGTSSPRWQTIQNPGWSIVVVTAAISESQKFTVELSMPPVQCPVRSAVETPRRTLQDPVVESATFFTWPCGTRFNSSAPTS
jgi:hypothetical protein